jgi:hypothetical protein
MNPKASLIKGVVCGVRVEDVADPLMRKIRGLDKLIDDLAKGKRWRASSGSSHEGRRASRPPSGPGSPMAQARR